MPRRSIASIRTCFLPSTSQPSQPGFLKRWSARSIVESFPLILCATPLAKSGLKHAPSSPTNPQPRCVHICAVRTEMAICHAQSVGQVSLIRATTGHLAPTAALLARGSHEHIIPNLTARPPIRALGASAVCSTAWAAKQVASRESNLLWSFLPKQKHPGARFDA